jgi:hypothetical protein
VATFARGRNLAAWLGLVPRQATTGGRPRLLGITKRGSKYLRKMLIQGARSALPTLSRSNTASVSGCAVCFRELIPIRLLSRLPPRWRAPSGRSCATAQRSSREQSLFDSTNGRLPLAADHRCLRVIEEDGLTVDRRSANLWRKMAPRCRPPYEDRNARISILANGIAERPDTFVQTVCAD